MDPKSFCRGVILGGLVGDCYGYVYEDRHAVGMNVPAKLIADSIRGAEKGQLIYTDDTQMGLAILRSLREKGNFVPEDVARQFTRDFFNDGAHRYYGGSIGAVFRGLESSSWEEPYKYAAAQFKGSGSFGNGGAMRVSPLAVYGLNLPVTEMETLVINATRITHTHPLAICGALLQAFAVRRVWQAVSKTGSQPALDRAPFLDGLLEDLSGVSDSFVDFKTAPWKNAYNRYAEKFSSAKKLLSRETVPTPLEVAKTLGNNLEAINSVPTAIYAFLQSLQPIPDVKLDSIPLRCLVLAVGIGGDTDTIGTMACSLAGGYVGVPTDVGQTCLPESLLQRCERVDTLKEMASWLGDRLAAAGR